MGAAGVGEGAYDQMSRAIAIMGESGSGKTTSCRNLDPKSTYYIDCDKKGLSWRGWRQQYNPAAKNYTMTDDPHAVDTLIDNIATKAPHIKTIVVDTINGIMVGDEMRRAREKGYDKWLDIATNIWQIIDRAYTYRDDLTIVFMAHSQTESDDTGMRWTRIKTSGRKLDKIVLESKLTMVLLAKCEGGKYVFETHSKQSTAKSPLGMFEDDQIDNDLAKVLGKMEEY